MDQRLVAHLKSYAAAAAAEDKPDSHNDINYHKIQQISEQLAICAKQATQTSYVGLEEMDRLCQIGEVLQKELYYVRADLMRRKNLELLLPSPNTQHHLPCSSLLSPNSTPSSPTGQQSMAMSTGGNSGLVSPSTTPTGSPGSPHGMSLVDSSNMSLTSSGILQSDEYWRSRKMESTKLSVRRSPTPLYVNLTEQMILAQSSKKRPAEGDLYCHNCKTKDTPEWRRGPMGAKTLCNACGIRWRLSQAEAAKQKKGEQLSPTQSPYSHLHQSPSQPTPPISVQQQSILQQQQQQQQIRQLHQQQQQMHQMQQQQQQQQQMQLAQAQYTQPHHAHQHSQQHMVGHVGLAQENIPGNSRMGEGGRGVSNTGVLSSLPMTAPPIAT